MTDNSKTTIDLILASDYINISQSGVIDIGLSDHCMIYCAHTKVETRLYWQT